MKCFKRFSIIIGVKDAQDIELYQARLFLFCRLLILYVIIKYRNNIRILYNMDSQDQINNGQKMQQPVQVPASAKCGHVPVIVLLTILLIGSCAFAVFELYRNTQVANQACSSECKNNGDGSSAEKADAESGPMITGNASFAVPNPPFEDEDEKGAVRFEYGVFDDILSTYSIYYYKNPYAYVVSEVVSNNVDLNTGEKLNNTEVLTRLGITVEDVYRNILENLVDTITIDELLLNTNGATDGEKISVADFKNNISEYVETLKNDDSLFYVFFKDSEKVVAYEQYKVLEKLDMSSHMGIGLVSGYVEVKI